MMAAALVAAEAKRPRVARHGRIGVFRALQLGDMLCTVPALRALRASAPDARVTLIGMPWAADFARRFDAYIDDFIAFPGFPSFPEQPVQWSAFPSFLAEVQQRRFDLLIQMHGSGIMSNPLAMLFGAKETAGFYVGGQYRPDSPLFIPWIEGEHEIKRFIRLMEHIGAPACGEGLEFPIAVQEAGATPPIPHPYVCIHAGARLPSRRWPPQDYAKVSDKLAEAGFHIVLTGTREEADVVSSVAAQMRSIPTDTCGKTSLGGLASLIRQAKLLICNDTGVSHVATALGTPSVIVSCGSDAQRWAPLDVSRHVTLAATMECRPCMHVVCPIGHPCARQITVEAVCDTALSLLEQDIGRNQQ